MYQDINWALRQKAPATCKHVLMVLANRADKNHKCFPSLTRLTADTGLNRVTVSRCIAQLLSLGLIAREKRGIQSNIYTLQVGAQRNHQVGAPRNRKKIPVGAQRSIGSCTAQPAVGAQRSTEPPIEPKENHQRGRRGQKTKPPEGFAITPEMIAWAAKENITANLTAETEKMLDHFRGNGEVKADWPATWRNWMRNADTFNNRRNGGHPNGSNKRTDHEKNVAALQGFIDRTLAPEVFADVPDVRKNPR